MSEAAAPDAVPADAPAPDAPAADVPAADAAPVEAAPVEDAPVAVEDTPAEAAAILDDPPTETGTFPRMDDVELVKRHYATLDAYRQSLTAGNPLSLEWLTSELSVG
jgi:hypothetical protein